ncbi:MAG: PQQ-binding-like beta-propeller repeat protein, partial [Planctomycetota bacterium]
GQEWTRFRGPNGSGISDTKGIPTAWTEKDYHWKVELPAGGHSSPVLWGDKIFLSGADDANAERKVFALNTAGKLLWSQSYTSAVHKRHKLNSFASPSATCDADLVYYSWSSPDEYTLLAMTHDGKEKWKRDLGPYVSQHSAGVSPIIYGNFVILVNCQDKEGGGQSSVIAVDKKTGETAWQLPCESTFVPYSTPCVRKNASGKDELIFNESNTGMKAVDPLTGKINWAIPTLINKRSVSSPVITAGGLITITCGSGGGGNYLLAVHPKDSSDALAGTVAYKVDKTAPYVPTPLAKGDRLFMMADNGIATSVNAKTGETIWQKRVGGTYYGSMVCIDDKLYCPTADGEIVVLSATDKYELIARNPLGETMHSSPAVAGGRLYLRTVNHLISIGGEKPKLALR